MVQTNRPQKISILVVVRNPIGGIRSFMKYVYPFFDKSIYNFTIATTLLPEGNFQPEDLNGIKVRIERTKNKQNDLQLLGLVTKLLITSKFDLIHSHGVRAALIASIPNFIFRVPHLATYHDVFRSEMFRGANGFLLKKLILSISRNVDRLHLVSKDAYSNIIEYFPEMNCSSNQIVVIPNGVQVEPFLEIYHKRKTYFEHNRDLTLFGFFGRFMPEKGFKIIIEAAIKLISTEKTPYQKFKITIVSDGGFIREDKEKIRKLNLNSYFEFFSFEPCIAEKLKQVDAVLMPSVYEASGLVAMETMVAGCPLIASDCIGLRETVEGSPAITVSPGDAKELADAMAHVINNSQLYNKHAQAYVAQACSQFNAQKTANKILDTIDEMMLTEK